METSKHEIWLRLEMRQFADEFHRAGNETTDINTLWESCSNTCNSLIENLVRSKLTLPRFKQVWINAPIKYLSRQKMRAYKTVRERNETGDWNRLRERERERKKEAQSICHESYNSYISIMLTGDYDLNSKKLWAFIESKRDNNTSEMAAWCRNGNLFSDATTVTNKY